MSLNVRLPFSGLNVKFVLDLREQLFSNPRIGVNDVRADYLADL